MLVLTRKPGESIHIGGDIKITVVEIGGGKIKLGIDAPRDVTIDRSEVAEAKAAGGTPSTPPSQTPRAKPPRGQRA